MTYQNQWIQEMIKMARVSLEAGVKNMDAFQAQAEKAMAIAMENAATAQDEARKALDAWMENVNRARKIYTDTIEEGLSSLEKKVSSK